MEKLLARILPYKSAKTQENIEGMVALKNLSRLETMLHEVGDDQIEAKLRFHYDDQGRVIAGLTLNGRLPLVCQRCLKPFSYPIHQASEAMIVKSEAEAKRVPLQYEAIVVDSELNTYEMVEDELIVSIPIMPVHDIGEKDCTLTENQAYYSPQKETYKPFLVLKDLKKSVKE